MENSLTIRVRSEPDRKVDTLVAFIAINPKTQLEGIMTFGDAPDRQIPLVFTAGNPVFDAAMELARIAVQEHGYPIEVRRYECVSRESVQ